MCLMTSETFQEIYVLYCQVKLLWKLLGWKTRLSFRQPCHCIQALVNGRCKNVHHDQSFHISCMCEIQTCNNLSSLHLNTSSQRLKCQHMGFPSFVLVFKPSKGAGNDEARLGGPFGFRSLSCFLSLTVSSSLARFTPRGVGAKKTRILGPSLNHGYPKWEELLSTDL